MKWSYRLGEWFGISVNVHMTFGLLLGWIGLSTLAGTGSWVATLLSLVVVMSLFGFVVLHEYGHALTARHFGVRTRDITLYPIGGVAALERMPESPRAQALIAVAGPLVNFVLAGLLAGFSWLIGVDPFGSTGAPAQLLGMMIQANCVLGLFNLLPALPMDGGRLFKALLSLRMGASRATALAARVARFVAVGMALYGVFADPARPILIAIAAFVWFTAGAEARLAVNRARVSGSPAWPSDRDEAATTVDRDGYVQAWPVDDYEAELAGYRNGWTSNSPAKRESKRESKRETKPKPAGSAPRLLRVFVVRGRFGPVLRAVLEEP